MPSYNGLPAQDPYYPPGCTLADINGGKEYPNIIECPKCGNDTREEDRKICCGCGEWGCGKCCHVCPGCHEWVHTDCHGKDLMCPGCELMAFIVKKFKFWGIPEEAIESLEKYNDLEKWWNGCDRIMWMDYVLVYLGIDTTATSPDGVLKLSPTDLFPAALILTKFRELMEASNA